jgi:hypothetical protein
MTKRLYQCEVCNKDIDKSKVVCIHCVERDLMALVDRFKKIERRLDILEDPLNEIFVEKRDVNGKNEVSK